MEEGRTFDHALPRVIVDDEAIDLGHELVAVAKPGAEPAGRLRPLGGAAHSIGAERVGLRPGGRRTLITTTRSAGVQRGRRTERRQQAWRRGRIIAGGGDVADAEIVGFELLRAREFERQELRPLPDRLLEHLSEAAIACDGPDQDLAEGSEEAVARGRRLALLAVARRDMADFVTEHGGEFRLVVHQAEQLARDVDIAARHRESVHDGRVQRGDRERAAGPRHAGLRCDPPPHVRDISGTRSAFRAAEFLHESGVLLGRGLSGALRNGALRLARSGDKADRG
jgi:hypothetical protein